MRYYACARKGGCSTVLRSIQQAENSALLRMRVRELWGCIGIEVEACAPMCLKELKCIKRQIGSQGEMLLYEGTHKE